MDQRGERIVLETDRHRVAGTLHLPADGYRSRLTDYLNAGERDFIALTDVEISSLEGSAPARSRPYVALARARIVLAMPAEPDDAEGL